jgi:hypothetical protein
MWRIDRALDLTAFAKSQSLDRIGREKHVGRFRREIPLRGPQESESLFGHLQPALHDDRLALRLRSTAALAATLIIAALWVTPLLVAALLVVATVSATALATAAALIVALILMSTMPVMMSAVATTAATAALPESTLATAGTEGALMALITLIALGSALLGISLVTGGVSA